MGLVSMPLKIVFVMACADLSGGTRVVATYARMLLRRGHRVTVISLPPPEPTLKARVKSMLNGKGWLRAEAPYPSHLDSGEFEHVRLERYRPVTEQDVPDADAVIATWWSTAPWVAALPRSKGVKLHFVQGHETFGGPKEEVDAAYRLPLLKITISGFLRDVLRDEYAQDAIALIPNGVDTERFDAPVRGKQQAPTVGLTYAVEHHKGTDVSLEAFALAARELTGLKLVAMGKDSVSRSLPLPPGADYVFQARDGQIRDTYARCDAWLFGSRREGFGLPVLEAMACRTPVIAAPAGAAPDVLARGGGLLVPTDDPRAMGEAICRVCRMPDTEWRDLSRAARQVATGFTWENATEQFERALETAVRTGASGRASKN